MISGKTRLEANVFTRPTLEEIITRIKGDIVTRITGAATLLRRSILVVLAKAYAGACHLLYGNIEDNKDQLFITTADRENLILHGLEYGIALTDAQKATGSITVTGTDTTVIAAGTELESATGWVYVTDSAATISGGAASIAVTAKEAGANGNEDTGAVLSFVSPIPGVNTTATIIGEGLSGGSNEEDIEVYRQRLLSRKRQPPHGGTKNDYTTWMLEVGGVTRAWTIPLYQGIGTVGCAFVRDDDDDFIPSDSEIAAVKSYIISHTDALTGKTVGIPVPAEAGLYMISLEKLSVNMTVQIYPNTSAIQALVVTAMNQLILEEGGPGETIYKSEMNDVIASVSGEERHKIELPSGLDYISASTNQIHVSGTITFEEYNG